MNDPTPRTTDVRSVAIKVWHAPKIEVLPLDHTAVSSYPGNDSGGAAVTSLS